MSNLLREYIVSILTEKSDVVPGIRTNSQIEDQIVTAAKSLNLADVSHAKCKGSVVNGGDSHCRIFLNDLKDKTDSDFKKIAKGTIESAFGGRPTVVNIGRVHSKSFDTYEVSDPSRGYTFNVVFSGGLTTGQRGGGYAYEGEVKKLLGIGGTQVEDVGADTTMSDVYVKTKRGKDIGIEVKGAGAKFGQPTIQYNYLTREFFVPPTSRSSKNAKLVVDILNSPNLDDDGQMSSWLRGLAGAWNKLHPEEKMEILGTQIKPADWDAMMALGGIKQSGPNVTLPISEIVTYYRKKKANYIQIQGKGLYAFNDVLELGVTSFIKAASNLNAFIKPEMLTSGGNKVLRASISMNYTTLLNSNMDLADPSDAKKFARALAKK